MESHEDDMEMTDSTVTTEPEVTCIIDSMPQVLLVCYIYILPSSVPISWSLCYLPTDISLILITSLTISGGSLIPVANVNNLYHLFSIAE